MAKSRYGKNPIKDGGTTSLSGPKEEAVRKSRMRGKTTPSGATVVTRNTKTNAAGGKKPLQGGTAAQERSTANYLKRIQSARSKDAAEKALKAAAKAGVAKSAAKAALRAVPGVGTALLAKDAYDAVTSENARMGKRTSTGGQMRKKSEKKTQKPPGY